MSLINLDQNATVSSIYNIIHDNSNNILDKFVEFINDKVDIDDIDDYLNEFKELYKNNNNLKLKKKKKDIKGETNPSVYNHFIKYKISTMDKHSGSEKGSYMTAAGDLWKSSDEGQYYKRRAKEIKEENNDITNKDIFDMIKNEWDEEHNVKKTKTPSKKSKKKNDSDTD